MKLVILTVIVLIAVTTSKNIPYSDGASVDWGNAEELPSKLATIITKLHALYGEFMEELESAKSRTGCEFCNNAIAYISVGTAIMKLSNVDFEAHIRRTCQTVQSKEDICDRAVKNINNFRSMMQKGESSAKMCHQLLGVPNCQPPKPTKTTARILKLQNQIFKLQNESQG